MINWVEYKFVYFSSTPAVTPIGFKVFISCPGPVSSRDNGLLSFQWEHNRSLFSSLDLLMSMSQCVNLDLPRSPSWYGILSSSLVLGSRLPKRVPVRLLSQELSLIGLGSEDWRWVESRGRRERVRAVLRMFFGWVFFGFRSPSLLLTGQMGRQQIHLRKQDYCCFF